MAKPVRLEAFGGMIPLRDAALLPDSFAAYCRNTRLYGGDIQGFRAPAALYTCNSPTAKAVYRIPNNAADPLNYANSLWLEFEDRDTDVVRAPVILDQYKRHYFASPSQQPEYNTLARLQAGDPNFRLGVPAPSTAPSIAPSGGTPELLDSRSYVYTWVTAYGEEGPPSPPTTETGTSDGTWEIEVTAPTPEEEAGRNLASVNIYRTITGSDGSVAYYLVTNMPIASIDYTDILLDTGISGNQQLASAGWTPPPDDLQGLESMSNGILVGWANERELWFCEPYRPHAWPAAYSIAVDYPIVGLKFALGALVVLTTATPYIVTGITPASMASQQVNVVEPCLSRRSIVAGLQGVHYASPNGEVVVSPGGTVNSTMQVYLRQQWNALSPGKMLSARYATAVLTFIRDVLAGVDNGFVLDSFSAQTAVIPVRFGSVVENLWSDGYSGSVLLLADGKVWQWDPESSGVQLDRLWRSKIFDHPYPGQYVCGKVEFEVPSWVTAEPSASTRNTLQPHAFDAEEQFAVVRVYGDGELILTREIQVNLEQMLFPGGQKFDTFQIEVEGQVTVKSIQFASSVKELRSV